MRRLAILKGNDRGEWLAVVGWVVLGLGALAATAHLHAFTRYGPGPGLLPRLTASAILLLAALQAVDLFFTGRQRGRLVMAATPAGAEDQGARHGRMRFALLALSLFAYGLLLEPVGFLLATAALGWLTLVLFGRRLLRGLIESVVAIVIVRFAFAGVLGVQLPSADIGWLNSLGF